MQLGRAYISPGPFPSFLLKWVGVQTISSDVQESTKNTNLRGKKSPNQDWS